MNVWLLFLLFSIIAVVFLVYPLRGRASVVAFAVIAVLVGCGFYSWGGLDYMRAKQAQVAAEKLLQSFKSPDDLIAKLKSKLDDTPKSAKGWYLLGRLYSGQNEYYQAVLAFKKAHALRPDEVQFTVNYGQSLWQMNHRQFSPEIIGIFQKLLQDNPQQPDALAMLAMEAYNRQDFKSAVEYWEKLLKVVPVGSEDEIAIRKAIAKARR